MRIHTSIVLAVLAPLTITLACTGTDETALTSPNTTTASGGALSQSQPGAGGGLTVAGAGGDRLPNTTVLGGAGGGSTGTGGMIPTGGSIPYGGMISLGGYWNTGGYANTGGISGKGYVAGMVAKSGGTRDLVSMQCLGEGPGCTHSIEYAACMVKQCPEQTGTAIPVTVLSQYKSLCGPFYTCMAYCPCGDGHLDCEAVCLADAKKSPDCYAALVAMDACAKATGCDVLGCPMIK